MGGGSTLKFEKELKKKKKLVAPNVFDTKQFGQNIQTLELNPVRDV